MEAIVDQHGRLVLPPDLVARLGLTPGTSIHIDPEQDGLRLRWPVTRLAKVYVEPTSACNLACRTCIRTVWDEPVGYMAGTTFERVLAGVRGLPASPTVFFGGYGEPLFHPHIIDMVRQVKALGATAELITNGTLLNEARTRGLIAAGLDVLWVSLDGATPESYTDVRLGATLPDVLQNLARFREARVTARHPTPEIGIVFVAMKRNIHDLPALLQVARNLGAIRLLVSNVLPHTPPMRDEVLYLRALNNDVTLPPPPQRYLDLPRVDDDPAIWEPVHQALREGWDVRFAGSHWHITSDRCPFIERGAVAVAWDGGISPCLPLLHSHASYLNGLERFARRYIVGNINERSLLDWWHDPDYTAFRARVQAFNFSPCTWCDGCSLSEKNEEDCFGNEFPTCGGCLWAQGVVQCP